MEYPIKNGENIVVVDIDFGTVFNWIFHNVEPGNNKIIPHLDMVRLFKARKLRKIKQRKIWYFTFMTIGEK